MGIAGEHLNHRTSLKWPAKISITNIISMTEENLNYEHHFNDQRKSQLRISFQ